MYYRHKQRIKEFYQDGFTLDELFIMYRQELPERDDRAYKKLRGITKNVERYDRI